MRVTLNGEAKSLAEGLSLDQLVRELSLEKQPIAVELNRNVVPRDRYGDIRLTEGDRLEIVTFVGGG
jgi:thiamine biosynthesis protein ThiS